MARLDFLASMWEGVRLRCHWAGHIADRVSNRALKKLWYLHMLFAIAAWGLCIMKVHSDGPLFIRSLLVLLPENITVWQTTLTLLILFYFCRALMNAVDNLGVESPMLDNLYSRSFFQATELTTALDAGFWTAMVFKEGSRRDIASLVFSAYYALFPAQAHEKVRRVRSALTIEHMRISWEKSTTPYLRALAKLLRPKFTKHGPREIYIKRPNGSIYGKPVRAWLYFDGSQSELQKQNCVVLDIPGGGFVAMNPGSADDRLLAWAGKTKYPILSLDYSKAPEKKYPYAIRECFDIYRTIVETKGVCLGLSGDSVPHIVVSGDSAGGNLATGLVLLVLSSIHNLPAPDGLVLAYPCLNMKVESWMTPEQVSLVRNKPNYSGWSGYSSSESSTNETYNQDNESRRVPKSTFQPEMYVSSMISFMDDRILTPETMRALILLYIGNGNLIDFANDYILSPVLAPSHLLAQFPRTYIIAGERDPLVDDTLIFAGRLREAKFEHFQKQQQKKKLRKQRGSFSDLDHVDVTLIKGVSHGFLQMAGIYPEAWSFIFQTAEWVSELLGLAELREEGTLRCPLSVPGIDLDNLVGEEELLERRIKFLAGGLVGYVDEGRCWWVRRVFESMALKISGIITWLVGYC